MTLAELEAALDLIIQDRSLRPYFVNWLNIAMQELAADLEFPALKTLTPTAFPITEDKWLFDAPENFLKMLFRCADANMNRIKRYRTMDYLDSLDLAHTAIADLPTAVCAAPTTDDLWKIGVYPRATSTIYLWFYQKPTPLEKPGDKPSFIPAAYHSRVLLPKATLKGFEHLQDQVANFDPKGLQYWQGKLQAGLKGSPVEGIGLVNFLAKEQGGPRRRGGKDPMGANYEFHRF